MQEQRGFDMNMVANQLTLSTYDIQRLERLLDSTASADDLPMHLSALAIKLYDSNGTAPVTVPADVITMNSQVRLRDSDADREAVYTLVFPHQANAAEGRISVLAPLGAALFGARVGDSVAVTTPGGARLLVVQELVYQPEAAGRYDL